MVQRGGKQSRDQRWGGTRVRTWPAEEAWPQPRGSIRTQSCCLMAVGVGGGRSWLERGK